MQEFNSDKSECRCPFLDQCCFIRDNAVKIPELIQRTRQRYCCNHPDRCARHKLYETIGSDVVPPLMLPDQHEWCRQIIEEFRIENTVFRTSNSKAK